MLYFVLILFREPIENYVFLFLSTEIKSSWEAYFLDAKQQLGMKLIA